MRSTTAVCAGLAALAGAGQAPAAAQTSGTATPLDAIAPQIESIFAESKEQGHVPALVYGIVKDGKLVLFKAMGDRDIGTPEVEPIDGDTRFRIASMSKAFTAAAILKLRDEGKLALSDPAVKHVPEMANWRNHTADAPAITIDDLLRHTGGFVEDNPWGDRQQDLPEAQFSRMIASGMDFATTPGTAFEYSNYGYALLGGIVSNVSGRPYQDYIREAIMQPLGMADTTYNVLRSPPGSRAIGYRWENGAFRREPDLADGAFGAMGGVETTGNDYAKWMAFLLSAWPASDAPDTGPLQRASVREMIKWVSLRPAYQRPDNLGPPCRVGSGYGLGLQLFDDCDLGRVAQHNGGYPGYGSTMQFMPDAGVGMFAFNARTYFSNSGTVRRALHMLRDAGLAPDRTQPISQGLSVAYAFARSVWDSGNPEAAPLAVNVALDRDIADRRADLAALKRDLDECDTSSAIRPISAMEGTFAWTCKGGTLAGRVQRAPVATMQLQVVDFRREPD